MSNSDGHGRQNGPTPDDRTLLDPLSSDDLEALRKARKRVQGKPMSSPSVGDKRQPDQDSANSRDTAEAAGTLPGFKGQVSLDQIKANPSQTKPITPRRGSPESAPAAAQANRPYSNEPSGGAVSAGGDGFGKNTLMWMQPPKANDTAKSVTLSDITPPTSFRENLLAKVRGVGLGLLLLAMTAGLIYALVAGGRSGTIELHTDPNGAEVRIDGQLQTEKTPIRLTMGEGAHVIELSKNGYEAMVVQVQVDPEKEARQEVSLKPQSAEGHTTVTIQVQPVNANITVDGSIFPGKRTLRVANLNPSIEHVFEIEAPGYQPVSRRIQPGHLKTSYSFELKAQSH